MIISASRRTDIPAFYSDWFMRRLQAGFLLVPNPWNAQQLGRLRLTPENVDCIIFWTKNPAPLLGRLDELDGLGYRYYFSFTLTAYGRDLEKNLPPKSEVLDTFCRLADRLGPRRVDWRFDPIMVSPKYPLAWHLDRFGEICARLRGHTERCIINFIKSYRHIASRITLMDDTAIRETALGLAAIAAEYKIPLYNCTEQWDLRAQGINFSACIDREKIETLTGWPLAGKKDPGQPAICRCLESVDIGVYGTCPHGCVYCYANHSEKTAQQRAAAHDPALPLLGGGPGDWPGHCSGDWRGGNKKIIDRTRPSLRDPQLKLL